MVAGLVIKATIPRGIRNNNPGNIRKNNIQWKGMSLIQNDPEFVRFKHPKYGFRAMVRIFNSYQARGLNTVQKIIGTYAPKSENNTGEYIDFVTERLNISHNELFDFQAQMHDLLKAISVFENGFQFINL